MNIATPARCAALALALVGLPAAAQPAEEPLRRPLEAASAPNRASGREQLERRRELRLERQRRGEPPAAAASAPKAAPEAAPPAPVAASPEAFWAAMDKRDEAQIEAQLRADPALARSLSRWGSPALHLATSAAVARLLLKAGADPNVENKEGVTALQAAARAGNERWRQVAVVLLEAGANTSFKPGTISPLLRAAEKGDTAVSEALLARGVPVDDGRAVGSDTPLIEAVRGGHQPLAELLLAKGARVDHPGDGGRTALARAAFDTRVELVKLLLAHKADINGTDSDGTTPLAYLLMRRKQSPEVEQQVAATVAFLRENGAREKGSSTVASANPRPTAQVPAQQQAPAQRQTQAQAQTPRQAAIERAVGAGRRAAAALKYERVSESEQFGGLRGQYTKGSPRVTLSLEIIQRSNGSVRFTGTISSSEGGARREAIRQYRAVLLKLLDVESPKKAGFEIEGNIVE